MSVLPTQTNWTLNDSIIPSMLSGVIQMPNSIVGQQSTVSTVVGGLTSTSVVCLNYVHPTTGGAAQFITRVSPSTNFLTVGFGQPTAVGEYANFIAKVQ